MSRDQETLSLAQIAIRAGVSASAVSNWRKRYPDFPQSNQDGRFSAMEINSWLRSRGKTQIRTEGASTATIWAAVDRARGYMQPEEFVPAGATLITLSWLGADLTTQGLHLGDIARRAENENRLPAGCLTEPLSPLLRQPENVVLHLCHAVAEVLADERSATHAFDELLSIGGPSRAAAESLTDELTIALFQGLLPPSASSVLDPACGSGALLLRAADSVSAARVAGYDINRAAWGLCVQRLLLHGRSFDEIHSEDALTAAPTGFDVVVAHPPSGTRIHPDSPAGMLLRATGAPPNAGDFAWILTARNALSEGGTAIVLTSAAPTFQRSGAALRHELVRSGSLKAVIALPAATLRTTGTTVASTIWVLGTPTPDVSPILMINGAAAERPEHITDAYSAWRDQPHEFEPVPGFSTIIPVLELLVGETPLNPAIATAIPIDPDAALETATSALTALQQASAAMAKGPDIPELPLQPGRTPLANLTDLATVIRPTHLRREDVSEEGTYPYVTGVTDGQLRVVGRLEELPAKAAITEPGDVVLSTTGRISATVDHIGGNVLGSSVWLVRPRGDLTAHPDVLALLLNSARIQSQTSGTTIQRLRSPKEITVACPDPSTIAALHEWLKATAQKRARATEYLQTLENAESAVVDALDAGAISPRGHA